MSFVDVASRVLKFGWGARVLVRDGKEWGDAWFS
ncbi:MAG: hypothetical protein ACI8Y4_000129 [Candidatus Poriferisodalaceae bacterium]|jgi:hypothetical protein